MAERSGLDAFDVPFVPGGSLLEAHGLLEVVVRDRLRLLILGETGVGKTWFARTVCELARLRYDQLPFVEVDLGAVVPTLAASELFGHAANAFTGAGPARDGRIREAHGGILFIDEIGHAPPDVQAKLLGVIESGRVVPAGGRESDARDVDVWVIGATSRPNDVLPELRFRLADLVVNLPTLAASRERIGPLAQHLLDEQMRASHLRRHAGSPRSAGEEELVLRRLAPKSVALLRQRDWPGNVRQLKSLMKRVAMLSPHVPREVGVAEIERALAFELPLFDERAGLEARLAALFEEACYEDTPFHRTRVVAMLCEAFERRSPTKAEAMRRVGYTAEAFEAAKKRSL